MAGGSQCRIETFVYFDLEATGLPAHGRPRITEVSLVGVGREELVELGRRCRGVLEGGDSSDLEASLTPRVMNKLTLGVYPMTTILPVVTELTGLDNYNLQTQGKFDLGLANLLSSFLSRLQQPVCLVAHNGIKYDFPLLMAEMEKVGGSLCSTLVCCDSWLGVPAILRARRAREEEERAEEEVKVAGELVGAGAFSQEFKVTVEEKSKTEGLLSAPPTPPPSVKKRGNEEEGDGERPKMRRSEEKTPERGREEEKEITKYFKVKKRLEFSKRAARLPASHSLANLHLHLLGRRPRESHGAEADCLALLRTTAALGQEWLEWADGAASPFHRTPPMW